MNPRAKKFISRINPIKIKNIYNRNTNCRFINTGRKYKEKECYGSKNKI